MNQLTDCGKRFEGFFKGVGQTYLLSFCDEFFRCGIQVRIMSTTDFATDPYATLGVQSSASLATIKSAWKVAALKYHPDKCGDDGTRFRAVQAAWEVLREGARPPMKGAQGSHFNAKRARHAKDSDLDAASQKADFDAKARAFVARQQAKKREYEATESPADAMKARSQARLEARYTQMMDQREAHAEATTADSSAASGLEPGRTKGPMWTKHQHERSTSAASKPRMYAPPTRAEELRAAHRDGEVTHAAAAATSSGCDARAAEIAFAFLTHPANASEPLEARVAFVLQQGVDEKCIREALRRAGWTSSETGTGEVVHGSALYEA